MAELLHWLMSSENFMPHGHCFLWQPATLWLNAGSDALIAGSYFAIPAAIYYFVRRRRQEYHFAWMSSMFAAFILLCGTTHVMEILTIWNPVYRVAGVLKLVTGLVSLATLSSLVWIMPRALQLKTPLQLQTEVQARTQQLAELNAQLRAEIAARDAAENKLDEARSLEVLTERFNLATREAHVGVWERWKCNEDVWWSETMYLIFGRDPASFQPSQENWIMSIHPEDREGILTGNGAGVAARAAKSRRYRIIRPDGSIRHVESIGATEWVDQRVAGILLDVTAQVETEQREEALQRQLRESSRQAGMAEIAIGVLHNVGNVLNSLGVATTTLGRNLKALRVEQLEQASALINDHRATLAAFLADDERGRHLPDYLKALSARLASEVESARVEIATIEQLLQHLRDIVSAQQAYAKIGGKFETVVLRELAESALLVLEPKPASVDIVKCYEDVPPTVTDRHKLLQILVNLISNARDAVQASATGPHRIVIRIYRDAGQVVMSVEDSGVGIPEEVILNLWRFGFSTKPKGFGFGLHYSANAAREIGATITAQSAGPGKGSQFRVQLPLEGGTGPKT
jgi:signal transduction histidine kinase